VYVNIQFWHLKHLTVSVEYYVSSVAEESSLTGWCFVVGWLVPCILLDCRVLWLFKILETTGCTKNTWWFL